MDAMASANHRECERLDRLTREVALGLIRLPTRPVTGTIECFLQRIVEETDVDRGTLIEMSDQPNVVEAAYGWARPSIAENDVDPGGPRLKWFLDQMGVNSNVLVFGAHPGDVPVEALPSVKSAIAIPVAAGGRHRYTLALEAVRGSRPWPEPVIERVRFLGEMLAGATHRLQQECAVAPSRSGLAIAGRRLVETEPLTNASSSDFDGIVGTSPTLQAALARMRQVAATDSTVLLLGETGTGKELFARAIHVQSLRHRHKLVSVNCAALPPTLIESELFGHDRGAFTGAVAERLGRFELAHRGTLFLDEIGDLPPEIQAKLLRVLQNREFERLGSSHSRSVDVRIIAATHHQLDAAVVTKQFRADLYYRLSVFPIRLPPLRERREDIPALVWAFIRKRQHAMGRLIRRVSTSLMQRLQSYSWPGNVRELENVIERALIHSSGDAIDYLDDFENDGRATYPEPTTLLSVERKHIQEVLRDCDWRINGSGNAAEQLGLHPNTLRFRMKKLGIIRTRPTPAAATLISRNHGVARRH